MDYFQTSQNPNVKRILDAIAQAEGTTEYGYNTMFGGTKFDDLSSHPNQLKPFTQTDGKENYSSAAGRYQFINPTWQDVSKQLGLKDFGPESQDAAAVYLIERAGALDDVLNGDFKAATDKLGGTWASLPSSNYAQPKKSEEEWMAMLNGGQQEPGIVESMVNAVIPTANASTVDNVAQMVLPQEAIDAANANSGVVDVKDSELSNDDKESLGFTADDLVYEIPEYAGTPNSKPQEEAVLANTLAAMFGPSGAGEIRTKNLNQTNPQLAQSFSNMRGNLGQMLPLALGASISNDVGARSMGRNILPLAMESMAPISIGEGYVLPDNQYVTDEALASSGSGSGSAQSDLRKPPTSMQSAFTEEASMADYLANTLSEFDDDYGGWIVDAAGDAANWVGNRVPGSDPSMGNWWSKYQVFVNKVRNKEFGSALTEPERREFLKASATPGLKPDVIRGRVENQIRILTNSMRTQVNVASKSGYLTNGFENELLRMQERNPLLTPFFSQEGNQKSEQKTQQKQPSSVNKELSDEELDQLYGA